jgi:hypothetical protein
VQVPDIPGIPSIPDLQDEATINTCVKGLTASVSKALADSTPKRRQGPDPRPSIQTSIQDKIRLKTQLRRQWRATRDPALKAEVNCLKGSVTNQFNEWRNVEWSNTLEGLDSDQSLWEMTRRVMKIPNPSSPGYVRRSGSFGLRETEALADSLEAQYQRLNYPSHPAVIEMVNEAMRAHSYAPASEPQ